MKTHAAAPTDKKRKLSRKHESYLVQIPDHHNSNDYEKIHESVTTLELHLSAEDYRNRVSFQP
jgi:hypothetical protein